MADRFAPTSHILDASLPARRGGLIRVKPEPKDGD
eukprot:CAMPEP_0118871264 /NCGR_PEP_ID=MMETSP1163-20130328/13904_1 /TAXON_ID=124430 /ORGANISM="Phaeomonas parva, Strain CCMP2877" /LENGTH=34 /DNA_ID= /DNA_START= /DNA_END= /DNA_ORIENTATION=